MLEGRCRVIIMGEEKPTKVLIYIPLAIARDSQFPFKETGDARIKVETDGRIIITDMDGG